MRAILVDTGKEVEVERVEPMDDPWAWYSTMWLTDKEGNMYHEDELVMIWHEKKNCSTKFANAVRISQ